jgi:hypothetical protein
MVRDLAVFLTREPLLRLGTIIVGDQPAAASAQFPAAAAVFELAHRRGGDVAMQRVVETTRRGMPTVAAVAAALGITAADLEAAWRALVLSYAASDAR